MSVLETANAYFDGQVPPGVPADAPEVAFDRLLDRARSLDTGQYPLDTLLPILIRGNKALGADDTLLRRLEAPEIPPLFVVAGQQAGLFGGPLYTLYKALHAIRLARRLEDVLSRPVLPLFWIASDDHDFDEVASLGLRSDDGVPDQISYVPANHHEGMPVGEVVLDDGIAGTLDRMCATLPPGPAGEAYREVLEDCWRPGSNWSEAFARQYAALLSAAGLVVFDPRWEGAKTLFGGIVDTELADPLGSTALVNKQADAFDRAADRKRAIRKRDDTTNLFLETSGRREAVTWDGNRFHAGGQTYAPDALRALAAAEPARFSPGAALRPVCQDTAMPVVATIGGPGERHYLQQIEPVYHKFGVTPSIVWARASFTVIDRKTQRNARKEGIEPVHLFAGASHIETELARRSFPAEVDEAFDTLERDMGAGFDRLSEVIGDVDKSLAGAVKKDRGRAAHLIEGLRERALRAHKAMHDLSSKRLMSASYFLLPEGGPQERWFGIDAILPVLDELGTDGFIRMTSPGEHTHRIVMP